MLWLEPRQEIKVTRSRVVVGRVSRFEDRAQSSARWTEVRCKRKRSVNDDLDAPGLRNGMAGTVIRRWSQPQLKWGEDQSPRGHVKLETCTSHPRRNDTDRPVQG